MRLLAMSIALLIMFTFDLRVNTESVYSWKTHSYTIEYKREGLTSEKQNKSNIFHENYGQSQHNVAENSMDFVSGIHGYKYCIYLIILSFSSLICGLNK